MRMSQAIVIGAVLLLGFLPTVNVTAQDVTQRASTESAQPRSPDSDAGFYAVATDDKASATQEPSNAEGGAAAADDENKPTCRWCQHGKLADPWTLPQPDCLKEHNITIGGWLDGGIYGNQ